MKNNKKGQIMEKIQYVNADLRVGVSGGRVVVSGHCPDGAKFEKAMKPSDAVRMWRCLMGEVEGIDLRVDSEQTAGDWLALGYDEHEEKWHLSDSERLVEVDADEAMALGWALKKCATDAGLVKRGDCKVAPVLESGQVWLLKASVMLTGDSAEEGAEALGTKVWAFSTLGKANGALRHVLRLLVNDAEPDGHWDDASQNVDDVLDDLIESGVPDGVYVYEGGRQTFRLELCLCTVDPLGELHEG